MMRLNPIIKRDLEMRSRRMVLPSVMMILNTVLFLIGLLGSFGVVSGMRESYHSLCGPILRVYGMAAGTAFLMILLVSPLFTAASISGERETGTFDLLLTTRLTPLDIVGEKLLSAALSTGIILISFWPGLLVPLMFGGVGIHGAMALLLLMAPGAFLMLCIGIFASAFSDGVIKSTILTYALGMLLMAGTVLIVLLLRPFMADGRNVFAYLLALNPLLPAFTLLSSQLGAPALPEMVFRYLGLAPDLGFLSYGALISVLVQLALSAVLVLLAVLRAAPGKHLRKYKKAVEKLPFSGYNSTSPNEEDK